MNMWKHLRGKPEHAALCDASLQLFLDTVYPRISTLIIGFVDIVFFLNIIITITFLVLGGHTGHEPMQFMSGMVRWCACTSKPFTSS
jgi:hypothetical protein